MEFTSAALPLAKSKRINPLYGVGGIGICVDAAQYSDRILAYEAASLRIVEPMSG
jgi:hypothetical protein